ncbi:unnamed protein product [Chondrus crispus]|uniref:Uncharacterized protein n=1 Tax=Chondrus crispus TaxID=2769 RepID=R7QPD6_CHOCR|nr:unnamed protein product [Chondrus crispus]CDF39633.1 unnamed protein product [Chondrus crispus]|eukprot:XP_005709927.1 unnamed protein product [Chondrus crispus]
MLALSIENCAREQELEKIALQTIEENRREEEMYAQEATELEGVVAELDSQKSKMPEDQQRLQESLREKRDVVEDRAHRKLSFPFMFSCCACQPS